MRGGQASREQRQAVLAERDAFLDELDANPGVWREVDPRWGIVAGPYTHAQAVASGVVPDAALYELYREGDRKHQGKLWMRRKPRPVALTTHSHVFVGASTCTLCGLTQDLVRYQSAALRQGAGE